MLKPNLYQENYNKGRKLLDLLYRAKKADKEVSFEVGTEEYNLCCLAEGLGLMNYLDLYSHKQNQDFFMINDKGREFVKRMGIG